MLLFFFFFFHAEDGIRDAQESRGLGHPGKEIKGVFMVGRRMILATRERKPVGRLVPNSRRERMANGSSRLR